MRKFFPVLLLLIPGLLFSAPRKIGFIHTNDLHSHLLGFRPTVDYTPFSLNDDLTLGGWARIATYIKREKAAREYPVFVLNAGDFLMGTLFHVGVRETGFELNLLHSMGVDYTTFGNHEFDFGPEGLAQVLSSARQAGPIPGLIYSNMIFSKQDPGDDSLEAFWKDGTVKPWVIREAGGLRIGFFGMMGKDALKVSAFVAPLKFEDTIKTARKMVNFLRKEKQVDMVVFISHGGLWPNPDISEDEIMAREVPGIDLIISGHTSERIDQEIKIDETYIVHTGAYGDYVGVMDMEFDKGRSKKVAYKLSKIDDSIPGDPLIQKKIDRYRSYIDQNYLKSKGLHFWQVLGETKFDLMRSIHETGLGNLITDSIRWDYNRQVATPGDKADLSLESVGMIRDDLFKGQTGKLTVADVFNVYPLGQGTQGGIGYPLVSFFVNARDIKDALEVSASVAPLKSRYFYLQVSGLKFTINPYRMPFDRVEEIFIGDEKTGFTPLDYSGGDKKLYRVVTSYFNGKALSLVKSASKGLLEITPKDKHGNPILDLKQALVDRSPDKPGLQEMMEYQAIMAYIKSFPDLDGNGIADLPEYYRTPAGRILYRPSLNPLRLLKNANIYTWSALLLVLALLGIALSVFRVLLRKRSASK